MTVRIGETAVRITSDDAGFLEMLRTQYAGFLVADAVDPIELRVEVEQPAPMNDEEDLSVENRGGIWSLRRGDFHATYDPAARRGRVRQSANRHSIDSVIRIVHSLELARGAGFLLHAASAVRGGRAFLFPGRSGAGKTTISRLAPAGVRLLTDEVSYVSRSGLGFSAWGTPFAGELAQPGENCSAPVGALYFLEQAPVNGIVPLRASEALRLLLGNILFFAQDSAMVRKVFEIAHEFIAATEVYRLSFVPDARVWEMVG